MGKIKELLTMMSDDLGKDKLPTKSYLGSEITLDVIKKATDNIPNGVYLKLDDGIVWTKTGVNKWRFMGGRGTDHTTDDGIYKIVKTTKNKTPMLVVYQ